MEDSNWYGPDTATFGDRLSAAREVSAMTQESLAKRLGVKIKTLQAWEQDLSEPRANRLSMISGLLNVSMVWLITGEGEGLAAPEEDPVPADLSALMLEIRTMKAQMLATSETLGKLEKKLRTALKAQV